jgi:DNA polymerase-3 subunit alpha
VTVGGMVAEVKKIRTRKGDPMMFCTLDDLEGQVEMIVFNSALEKHEGKLDGDRVVLVRARIDKKESDEVKLVAQDVEVFEPTPEEVEKAAAEAEVAAKPRRLILHVNPGVPSSFIDDLRGVVEDYPGSQELMLRIGERRLLLGPDFRVSGNGACCSQLDQLEGTARVVA